MIFGLVVFAAVALARRVASSAGHIWRRRRVELGRAGRLQLAAPVVAPLVNGIYLVNETPHASELEHGARLARARPRPREVERTAFRMLSLSAAARNARLDAQEARARAERECGCHLDES